MTKKFNLAKKIPSTSISSSIRLELDKKGGTIEKAKKEGGVISPPKPDIDEKKWMAQDAPEMPVVQHKTSLECDKDLFLRVKAKASLHNTNVAEIYRAALKAYDKTHGYE